MTNIPDSDHRWQLNIPYNLYVALKKRALDAHLGVYELAEFETNKYIQNLIKLVTPPESLPQPELLAS